MRHKKYRQIVEPQSAKRKVLLLKEEIKELQRAVGEKQFKLDLVVMSANLQYSLLTQTALYGNAFLQN